MNTTINSIKMKTMKTVKFLSLFLAIGLVMTSCDSDDDNMPVNEEEVITTLTATLMGGGSTITLTSRDLDGDGPNAPVVTVSGALAAGTTYTGSLDLLNETEDPAESITEEIAEEDDEHQFFFASDVATFAYADMDGDGNPIGLAFTMTTGAAGTGDVTITLRHEPAKSAAGVSGGDITNAGGETDISVTFADVVVQ